jgi:hypothetical protein
MGWEIAKDGIPLKMMTNNFEHLKYEVKNNYNYKSVRVYAKSNISYWTLDTIHLFLIVICQTKSLH